MSLNDFFAANAGGVFLRPVGLPDCFSLPAGLPHGCKPPPPPPPPPPLTMQHPCSAAQQKPRTMATVSPLHQVVPPQPNISPYEPPGGLNAFGPSQRTSSFAAALRKLAKQAGDPIVGEKDISQISPVSSPALAQRSLTPKRNGHSSGQGPAMYHASGGHQVNNTSFPSSSPPVVTIAPSRQHPTHTTDSRKLQMDLVGLSSTNPAPISNGHLADPITLKLDGSSSNSKSGARSSSNEKWEDHTTKSLTNSSSSSQSRPHATIAPLPRPDDSLTSSRGFQPYRSADDIRNSLPHHLSPFEHHPPAAYPYTPAFLPPPHLPHPAYRIDDALFLDRYGLLRSQVVPFPGQPGMMGSPAAFYPQSRYDLLQSLSLTSANNTIIHHERLKLEEERRQREKEAELDHSRKRELERREKEQKEKEHKEREKEHKEREKEHREKEHKDKERRDKSHRDKGDHGDHKSSISHSKRTDHSGSSRNELVVSGTISSNHSSPPTASSTPLNLVVQPTNINQVINPEHHKKEAELWLPWQQNPTSNHHSQYNSKDSGNHDETSASIAAQYKVPHSQENHKHHHPAKDIPQLPSMDKYHSQYNVPFYPDNKKHPNIEPGSADNEMKKHYPHYPSSNNRKFDSIHHHITELSKKEPPSSEWKHEKLQKACTNNHRKTINEVKKLREETHQYHHHSSHQQQQNSVAVSGTHNSHHRKHVNGIIKPAVLSQDEGMHARLLETEKCRLEFNSTKLQSPEKPPVPSLVHGIASSGNREIVNNSQLVQPPTIESEPVRSKLDKEAADAKKDGGLDVEAEDFSMKDYLVLKKGPALLPDTSPEKVKFLNFLGLASRSKRKKIEFDIYLKRRKLLKDESPTRVLTKEECDQAKTSSERPLTVHNSKTLSEKLRLQNNHEKTQFMLALGLTPLSLMEKDENEKIRNMLGQERSNRYQREKFGTSRLLPYPISDSNSAKGIKTEKVCNEINENSNQNEAKSSQKIALREDEVPYMQASQKDESTSRALYSSTSIWESHQSSGKMRNKLSFKRGLKREWNHPPILPLNLLNNHSYTNGLVEVKNERKTISHISTATQVDLFASSASDKKDKCKNFNWPGLDALIEAYYRHNNEQIQEKDALNNTSVQLKTKQEELKKEASSFSKVMTDLLKRKRDLEETRIQAEKAVENLKRFIDAGR